MCQWISKILIVIFGLTVITPSVGFAFEEPIVQKQKEFDKKWREVLFLRGNQDPKQLDFRQFDAMRQAEMDLQRIGREALTAEKELSSRSPNTWSQGEIWARNEIGRNLVIYQHYANGLPDNINEYRNQSIMQNNANLEQHYTNLVENLTQAGIRKSELKLYLNDPVHRNNANRDISQLDHQIRQLFDGISRMSVQQKVYDPLTLIKLKESRARFDAHFARAEYQPFAKDIFHNTMPQKLVNNLNTIYKNHYTPHPRPIKVYTQKTSSSFNNFERLEIGLYGGAFLGLLGLVIWYGVQRSKH